MGSANSDSVGRYSGARGRPRSHAGTGGSVRLTAAAGGVGVGGIVGVGGAASG